MADIMEVIGRNPSTIYNYAGLYRDGGIDGLVSHKNHLKKSS
ncbi:MAG: helix-turn-helix domain-containing protein [Turicibacter sp.]|nr:helix-turn-helix domain-containing protein [Turicibacter sp.]